MSAQRRADAGYRFASVKTGRGRHSSLARQTAARRASVFLCDLQGFFVFTAPLCRPLRTMGPLAPLLRLIPACGRGEWTYPPKRADGGFFRRLSERRRTPIRTRAFLTLYEVRRPAATAFFAAFRLRNALQSGSARAAALSRTNKTDSRSTCSPSAFSAYCAVSAASSQAYRYRPYSTSNAIAPNSRLTVTVRRRLGCGSTK